MAIFASFLFLCSCVRPIVVVVVVVVVCMQEQERRLQCQYKIHLNGLETKRKLARIKTASTIFRIQSVGPNTEPCKISFQRIKKKRTQNVVVDEHVGQNRKRVAFSRTRRVVVF